MDILVDADSDRDSHFLPTACDFRSLCPIVPNLGYIPWVFSEGCAGDLNWMNAYKASLDSAVKAHKILHQGTREKTGARRKAHTRKHSSFLHKCQAWRGWCPEDWETEAPWYLHLSLQSSHQAVCGGTLSCFFGMQSRRIYFIGCRCKFWIKNENVWTELNKNLPDYSKYH